MDALIDRVMPWFIGQGFERDGVFRKFSEAGDCLVVDFQVAQSGSRDVIRFYLNIGLVLYRWQEWKAVQTRQPSYVPNIDDAQVWSRLRDPNATQFKDYWQVGIAPFDLERAAKMTVTALEPSVNMYSAYLDRTTLLALLAEGDVHATMVNKRTTTALLLMDHGNSGELAQLLDQMRARGPLQSALADWIWNTAGA